MRAGSAISAMMAAAVAIAPVAASAGEIAGTIASVSGNAFVARNGRLLRAVPSMRLVRGDRIVTQADGFARVTMSHDCTLDVGASASIRIATCGDPKRSDFPRARNEGSASPSSGGLGAGTIAVAVGALAASVLGIVAAASSEGRPNSP